MAGALEIGVWCLLITASITDILWGKIFNALTFPFLLLGLGLRLYFFGFDHFLAGLLAIASGFALFFPLYFSKIMAAGDVKLLMASAAWMTPFTVLQLAAVTIVVGSLGGLLILLIRKGFLGSLKNLLVHLSPDKKKQSTRMPFAPAFLCAFSFLKIAEIRGWTW